MVLHTTLEPVQQLRPALERLPNPEATCADRTRVAVPAATQAPEDAGEIEFHRETFTTEAGDPRRIWVWEGPVAIDTRDLSETCTRDALGEHLRAELGHRCVDVS